MYIFSVLVTDDPNCWFAVKPGISNLKTHARLHDCTRLQHQIMKIGSRKNKFTYTHCSRTSAHINPTVNSVYLHIVIIPKYASCVASVLCGDTGCTRGSIIWLMLSPVWLRGQLCCVLPSTGWSLWWSFFCYDTQPPFDPVQAVHTCSREQGW